jgi:hypothetical protein
MKNFILCMLAVFAMSFAASATPPGKVESVTNFDLPEPMISETVVSRASTTSGHEISITVHNLVVDAVIQENLVLSVNYTAEPSRRLVVANNSKTVRGNWDYYSPPEGGYISFQRTNKQEQLKRIRMLS